VALPRQWIKPVRMTGKSMYSFVRGFSTYICILIKKRRKKFPHISGNSEVSGAKSYISNDLLIYGENICVFPHICIRKPFLIYGFAVLHPIPSEFLDI
jgi:hypothetical protein